MFFSNPVLFKMTVLVRKRAMLFVSFLFVQGKSTFTFPRGRTTSTKWWTIIWFIAEWYRYLFVMSHVSQSILVQFSDGWSYMIGIYGISYHHSKSYSFVCEADQLHQSAGALQNPFLQTHLWCRFGLLPHSPKILMLWMLYIWRIILSSHFWD